MQFSLSYNLKGFKGKMQFYGFVKNEKPVMMVYECLGKCQKNFSSIENILSPTFSDIKIKETKASDINVSNSQSEVVGQLEKLRDLYKAGVLTKEEFEKAKEKILN